VGSTSCSKAAIVNSSQTWNQDLISSTKASSEKRDNDGVRRAEVHKWSEAMTYALDLLAIPEIALLLIFVLLCLGGVLLLLAGVRDLVRDIYRHFRPPSSKGGRSAA
jgi:hypothetical protein